MVRPSCLNALNLLLWKSNMLKLVGLVETINHNLKNASSVSPTIVTICRTMLYYCQYTTPEIYFAICRTMWYYCQYATPEIYFAICRTMLYYCQYTTPGICFAICRTMLYYYKFPILKINLCLHYPGQCCQFPLMKCVSLSVWPCCIYCQFPLLKDVSPSVEQHCIIVNLPSWNNMSDDVVLKCTVNPHSWNLCHHQKLDIHLYSYGPPDHCACSDSSDAIKIFLLVRCLSGLNVNFCKKSPKLAQMTFDRYLSNPDIGRTFWDGLTPSN